MIKSLEIHNFRCFEKTKLSGFSHVNLIGGKNNSGKTALLEAIYLNSSPEPESINFLRRLRRDSLQFLKAYPERAWDNLFFNQNKNAPIDLRLEHEDKTTNVRLFLNDSMELAIEFLKEDESQSADDLIDLRMLLQDRKATKSILCVSQGDDEEIYIDSEEALLFSMIAHSGGISVTEIFAPTVENVNFVPVSFTLSNPILAQEYDSAYLQGNSDKVLQAIQVIDGSIIEAKTLSIGEPILYLKRKEQNFLPVPVFGEAINKVADLLIRLVNNPGSIFLVDEVENGIHHTSQRKLWEILFKLSVEFEIQIFATTHSLEMITAFKDVGLLDNNEGVGAYFELTRNIRTGQITGIEHKLGTLDYELKRQKVVRGEQRFNR